MMRTLLFVVLISLLLGFGAGWKTRTIVFNHLALRQELKSSKNIDKSEKELAEQLELIRKGNEKTNNQLNDVIGKFDDAELAKRVYDIINGNTQTEPDSTR